MPDAEKDILCSRPDVGKPMTGATVAPTGNRQTSSGPTPAKRAR